MQNLYKHLLVVLLTVVVAAAHAQPPQGLLSRFIAIKYSSELFLLNQLRQEKISQGQKDSALAIYNTLRLKVDGFLYQLSSEMIAANSPQAWRRLNTWCLQAKGRPPQLEDLAAIENFYATHIESKINPTTKTLNLTTNVFYLLKDSYTIIQGLSALKTQKTMALIELMDHTRLLSPGDLMKGVK